MAKRKARSVLASPILQQEI